MARVYVDVCDDVDVTHEISDMDEAAKRAGMTAVIGMGSSPGATNLLAKFAADNLLDETVSIDIFHAHGGEPFEGAGMTLEEQARELVGIQPGDLYDRFRFEVNAPL